MGARRTRCVLIWGTQRQLARAYPFLAFLGQTGRPQTLPLMRSFDVKCCVIRAIVDYYFVRFVSLQEEYPLPDTVEDGMVDW
jgi:hypothetical protein